MAATNFHTFCVSPDYAIPNSWKESLHIIDDFNCYKILLSLHLNDTFATYGLDVEAQCLGHLAHLT